MSSRTRYLFASLLALGALARPARAATGGPDAGGYYWRDSAEPGVPSTPSPFTGPTTLLTLTDESVLSVSLPFPFPFYGLVPTSTVWVSDNGWLSFVNPAGPAPGNVAMPDPTAPNAIAAFNWDDLLPAGGIAMHGTIAGGYGILLREVQRSTGWLVQVMVELYPSGRIRFVCTAAGDPITITIGIEDETGTQGTGLLHDGAAAPGFGFGAAYAVEFAKAPKLACTGGSGNPCGSTQPLSTLAGRADASDYSCDPGAWSGRELVIPVDLASTSTFMAILSGFAPRQMGLFLLGGCNENACLGGGAATLTAPLGPGRYYLVVEGRTAADDGDFTLAISCGGPLVAMHTGWRSHPGGPVVRVSPPFPTHGHPGMYAHASFPSIGDPDWTPTPDPNYVGLSGQSPICDGGGSCPSPSAPPCLAGLAFTYFRTCLWLPATFSELIISASALDDGVAVRLNGVQVGSAGFPSNYLSPNLAGDPALVPGALNDIEVIHVEDCGASTAMSNLTFTVDGNQVSAGYVADCAVQASVAPVSIVPCPGSSVQLDASPSRSTTCTSPLWYRWREGANPLGPSTPVPTIVVNPAVTTTYHVDVSCSSGCGCHSTQSLIVNVTPAIVPSLPDRVYICPGGTAELGGGPTASGGTPPLTYSWTPVSWLDDPASPNPQATPPSTTTYTVEVTDGAGCRLTHDEIVEISTGGLPSSLGNTLLGRRAGADAGFQWSGTADAVLYHLKGDVNKGFPAPVVLLDVTPTTATDIGAITRSPGLIFYRVVGMGCSGEGP